MTFVSITNIYGNLHIIFTLEGSDISWICAGNFTKFIRGTGLILGVEGLFEREGRVDAANLAYARA